MSLLEGDGPDDVRYRWLPEVEVPDADGLLVCQHPVGDERRTVEADFWPLAPGVLIEAAGYLAGEAGVQSVIVHRRGADRFGVRLAVVVGLRLAAQSGGQGLVLSGGPLDELEATLQDRRLVRHELLVWESGQVWEARRVWEVMAPDRYEKWMSRRQMLGLDRRP